MGPRRRAQRRLAVEQYPPGTPLPDHVSDSILELVEQPAPTEVWENVLPRASPSNLLALMPNKPVNPLTAKQQAQSRVRALGSEGSNLCDF